MEPLPFRDKLRAAASAHTSWLCVGLDPDPGLAPPHLVREAGDEWIETFNRGIVEATQDLVCAYKPNVAFYEAYGESGRRALKKTLEIIPRDVPVIVDAKRADIGNTSRGYARAVFEELGGDAITVSPYLGGDSLEPFFDYPGRGVFVLCKTSNPGAVEIQDLRVQAADGAAAEPLYRVVARLAQQWDQHESLGLVVGATYPEDLASVRACAPEVPILIPGIGAQAGDLEAAVRAGADQHGEGAIVNASRSVLYASRDADWQAAARAEALRLRNAIARVLRAGLVVS